jgi:hypothetical protein
MHYRIKLISKSHCPLNQLLTSTIMSEVGSQFAASLHKPAQNLLKRYWTPVQPYIIIRPRLASRKGWLGSMLILLLKTRIPATEDANNDKLAKQEAC